MRIKIRIIMKLTILTLFARIMANIKLCVGNENIVYNKSGKDNGYYINTETLKRNSSTDS